MIWITQKMIKIIPADHQVKGDKDQKKFIQMKKIKKKYRTALNSKQKKVQCLLQIYIKIMI